MTRAALALVAGIAIYALARDGLVLHAWLGDGSLAAPDWVRFQLPDALWQYAFCMVVYSIWRDARTIALPLALGLLAELLVGTFDPRDMIALIIAAAIATLDATRTDTARRAVRLRSDSTA